MSNLETHAEHNFKVYTNYYKTRLVDLRNLRKGMFDCPIIDGVKAFSSERRNKAMLSGLRDALQLWSVHFHGQTEKVNRSKNAPSYTLGHVLFLILKGLSKEDKDREVDKYRRSARNITSFIRYMTLKVDQLLRQGETFTLNYGYLAYLFSLIHENPANLKRLHEYVWNGYERSRKTQRKAFQTIEN